jgi:hypothetical protein
MTPDQKTETLRTMLKDYAEVNRYMFHPGGTVENPETERRSTCFPHVVILTNGSQMGEAIEFALDDDDDGNPRTFEEMMEALKEEIGFGAYLLEEGGNLVHHWMDYGFKSEEEAWEAHRKELQGEHLKAETVRLAWLRRIKEAVE